MQEPAGNEASPTGVPGENPPRTGSAGRRVLLGILELVELQARLVGLKILATLQASAMRMGLVFLAVLVALAGVVFLYLAVFQSLDRIIPARDVFLLFALFHFILAGGLWLAAGRITDMGSPTRSHRDKSTNGGPNR